MVNNELTHHGIKGQRWGVRRYQNKDGTLTKAGQRRYDRDQRENAGKKKGNRVGAADPNRWVREDMERSKKLADNTSQMTRELKRITDDSIRSRPKQKMDLSKMTDQEMRAQINRAVLEKQYNDMFAPQTKARGREYVSKTLDVAGNVLAVGSSALAIALAIKELKG